MCGAGRVVCLIDPIGEVYACPFVIHDEFRAGSVRDEGGFTRVWRESELFQELRQPQSAGACASCGSYDACQGGCMAAKFFVGPARSTGPTRSASTATAPSCWPASTARPTPRPGDDHSKPAPVTFTRKPLDRRPLSGPPCPPT